MILFEMFDKAIPGYQDVNSDNSRPDPDSLRKTKLTLRQLNKLRKMNDVRNYEYQQKLKQIQQQYAAPSQPTL